MGQPQQVKKSEIDRLIKECYDLAPEMRAGVDPLVLERTVSRDPRRYCYDWYSNVAIRKLKRNGDAKNYWEPEERTNKGTLTTVGCLLGFLQSPREQMLIWISAWLHDYNVSKPKHYDLGYPEKLIQEFLKDFPKEDRYEWHKFARAALPEAITSHYMGEDRFKVTDLNDLRSIMALDITSAYRSGRPVIIYNLAKDDEDMQNMRKEIEEDLKTALKYA